MHLRLVVLEGPGGRVRGVCPARHPVVRDPVGAAGEGALEDPPVEVRLLGARRVVRKCSTGALNLLVVDLRNQ